VEINPTLLLLYIKKGWPSQEELLRGAAFIDYYEARS
jgi:hypothetical protein